MQRAPLSTSAATTAAPSAPVPPVTTTVLSVKDMLFSVMPNFWPGGAGSAPPALHAHRQHLKFDPVRHLADAQLLVEDVLADAVPPRQPLAGGVAVQRIE